MANLPIPIIELTIEALNVNPVPVEVGLILPGPKGDPVEIYRSTELPNPNVGGEGALWIKYVPSAIE